jgi:hypothetical protein
MQLLTIEDHFSLSRFRGRKRAGFSSPPWVAAIAFETAIPLNGRHQDRSLQQDFTTSAQTRSR